MKLHKIFLDVLCENGIGGYYYIMYLQIGPFAIGFTGIYHFTEEKVIVSFKFERVKKITLKSIGLKNSGIRFDGRSISLSLNHHKYAVNGRWEIENKYMHRRRKPLYQNKNGQADWKVLAPKANVTLKVFDSGEISTVSGNGYCDLVKFTIAPWKIPFRKLYWGQFHSGEQWFILLQLTAHDGDIKEFLSSNGSNARLEMKDLNIAVEKNSLNQITRFNAQLLLGDTKTHISIKTEKEYESMELLDRGILHKLIPNELLKKISSSGRDSKYYVSCMFDQKEYKGIMEEVIWHE